MNPSDFKIKKKEVIPQKPSTTQYNEDLDPTQPRKSRKRRLKLPETDVQKIFEGIIQEASRDETVYKTLCSIINFANKEIVSFNSRKKKQPFGRKNATK